MPLRRKKRKKAFWKPVFIILGISAFIAAASLGYQWLQYRKAKFRRYPEFGISIPTGYMIHGIDVSRYQEIIAWEEVQTMLVKEIRLGFAFIKATEGIGNTDPQFNRNWKKAKSNGIIRGAYHFFIPSKDGRMQAEHFIKHVSLVPGDLPPVLDIEQENGTPVSMIKQEVKTWLTIVENYYGVRPIIYTNVDFYKRVLGNEFDEYPLWVAHYYEPSRPGIKRNWAFWQHSDEGRVNGILSRVDFNVFNGDSLAFRELLVK
jgi:lysozyme